MYLSRWIAAWGFEDGPSALNYAPRSLNWTVNTKQVFHFFSGISASFRPLLTREFAFVHHVSDFFLSNGIVVDTELINET